MGGSTNERASRLPGLDAIRVLAVVAVLLYHADEIVTGGLLGVTVFFVLSGFLITGQVWNGLERNEGRLDAKDFWSRRVRRLLPASLLVVLTISVLWPALGYDLPLRDVLSAVLPVRNWAMLGSDAGYGASPSPTTHFWSLAVEEQVYLVLPLLLVALARLRSRTIAGAVLAVLAAAAMAAGAVLAGAGHLDQAYLSTYTRAGEVLAGAGAVLLWRRRLPPRAAALMAAAGVIVLAAVFVLVSWPSPNVSTIGIPVTVVATLALCGSSLTTGTWWTALGRTRIARAVADHAYELYLVHVPVYALVNQYRTGLSGVSLVGVRLAATVLLAAGLHAIVEPIRRREFAVRPITFATTFVLLALLSLVVPAVRGADDRSLATATASELPDLPGLRPATAATVPNDSARRSGGTVEEASASLARPAASPTSTVATPSAPEGSVWFLGDSTLRELDDPAMTSPTLSAALADAGWHVSGGVALRALRLCAAVEWDGRAVGEELVHLPAARDVISEWWAVAPGDHVIVQLGANDLSNGEWDPDAVSTCLRTLVESLPSDVVIVWIAPVLAEWCWCATQEPRNNVKSFVDILQALATTHPNLSVALDGLSLQRPRELRKLMAEDGIHATETGRAVRVASLVEQLGPGS